MTTSMYLVTGSNIISLNPIEIISSLYIAQPKDIAIDCYNLVSMTII